MHIIDQATIAHFHDYRSRSFGAGTAEALGWGDAEGQRQRFEVLMGVDDLNGGTVLDAGCGYGDLFGLLLERCPGVQYTGMDCLPAVLDVALQRWGQHPQARFLLGDITAPGLPEADHVFCSGALNYRRQENNWVQTAIAALYAACRRTLAFNLLSRVQDAESILVAYEPETILEYCRRLTPQVQLLTHYRPGDFTVYMYR